MSAGNEHLVFVSNFKRCKNQKREWREEMSDTPRTDDQIGYDGSTMTMVRIDFARQLERKLNYAVNCINAIEAHYKAKHGESYDHTTLHTIIENWRNK